MKLTVPLLLFSIIFTQLINSPSSFAQSSSKTKVKKRKALKKKKARKKSRLKKKSTWFNTSLEMIDSTQKFISNQWTGLNYSMDTFFSDELYKRDQNRSHIMAYYGFFKKESSGPEYNFDIKIKVHLPKTTKRMKIVVEKERNEIFESVNSGAGNFNNSSASGNASNSATKSNYIAGLTYLLFDSKYWQTFVDTGMKILLPLDPFTKIRIQKEFKSKLVNIYASQRFILYRQRGFSEITQLSFHKKLNETFQTELVNALSWADEDDTFALRHHFALHQRIDDKKSLSYVLGANARFVPMFHYTSYDAAINYRQLIYKNWLFANLSTGGDFPRSANWSMEKFIYGRIEVFFR